MYNHNFILIKIYILYRFIEERSFVSDMDMAGLAFFDECTERVEEENGMNKLTYIFLYMRDISHSSFNFQ